MGMGKGAVLEGQLKRIKKRAHDLQRENPYDAIDFWVLELARRERERGIEARSFLLSWSRKLILL